MARQDGPYHPTRPQSPCLPLQAGAGATGDGGDDEDDDVSVTLKLMHALPWLMGCTSLGGHAHTSCTFTLLTKGGLTTCTHGTQVHKSPVRSKQGA